MATITQVDSLKPAESAAFPLSRAKKGILIALSIIFALGMVITYSIGAPWLFPFIFFSAALAPLYPLGKAVNDQKDRIKD